MLFLYNVGLKFYLLTIHIFSLFNNKARLWISGRKQSLSTNAEKTIWFHFASLGEFEQGRPVLEQVRKQQPGAKIVITFFSPSALLMP